MNQPSGHDILALPISYCDCGAKTIKEYLILLLSELWEKQHLFNGKRPWGSSGWDFELYKSLVENNVVKGTLDDDGWIEEIDIDTADNFIRLAIQTLGE